KPKFSECYAELARLSASYSPSKGRLPTCYAPVRRAPPVLLQARTRLACVKHAASVRSEPGSNSRLKLVAWAKKNAPICIGASLPKQIIVARIYSDHSRSKTRMASNRFWHIVSVVKERGPPVQQKGSSTAQRVCQVH